MSKNLRNVTRLWLLAATTTVFASGCAMSGEQDRDARPVSARADEQAGAETAAPAQSMTRLEDKWGPGSLAAVCTGTVSSKDKNLWINFPTASWYQRSEDRKGKAILGGALAYDFVTVQRENGQPVAKQLSSIGFLGIAGRVERHQLDNSGGYSKNHWFFPFYRYRNCNGQRTVYPLFLFPIGLKNDPASQALAESSAPWANGKVEPIDPAEPVASARRNFQPLNPPPRRVPFGVDSPVDSAPTDVAATGSAVENFGDIGGDVQTPTALPVPATSKPVVSPASRPTSVASKPAKAKTKPTSDDKIAQAAGKTATKSTPKTYVVKSGDNLSKIAKQVYGRSSEWTRIHNANRQQLPNPDRLTAGMTLALP
ncbi:MAG: LysM peptidoglycan-binding domain-containing protein [Planctomycetota bacterium]